MLTAISKSPSFEGAGTRPTTTRLVKAAKHRRQKIFPRVIYQTNPKRAPPVGATYKWPWGVSYDLAAPASDILHATTTQCLALATTTARWC